MNDSTTAPTRAHLFHSLALPALAFILSFSFVVSLIHLSIDEPIELYAQYRSEKFAMLDADRRAFRFAAFGSSHVHNGFDPRAFDQAMTSLPNAKSINLSVQGGSQTEQVAMAKRYARDLAVDTDSHNTHFLLLEANAGVNFQLMHLIHPRAINIYDADIVRLVLGFGNPRSAPLRYIGRSGYALTAAALHYLNVGMLANLMFRPAIDQSVMEHETVADRRGLHALINTAEDTAKVQRAAANRPSRFDELPVIDTMGLESVSETLRASTVAKDIATVFIVTPKFDDTVQYRRYPLHVEIDGACIPIVNVAIPDMNPELYEPKYWHDTAHLNEAGAGLYSTLLARKLMELNIPEGRNICKAHDAVR